MRLGRVPYWLLMVVLTGAQVWALSGIDAYGAGALGMVAALQVVKALGAIPRLKDLGRPADDAMLAVIPLASIGLFLQLREPTPSKSERRAAILAWRNQPTASQHFVDGVKTLLRYPVVMFGLALPAGMGAAAIDLYVTDAVLAIPANMEDGGLLLSEVLLGITGFLILYFILQIGKRKTASRASWWPTAFIVPMGLAAVVSYLGGAKDVDFMAALARSAGNDQLMPYLLGTQALWLAYAVVVGGLLATAWAVVAADSHEGGGGEPVMARISRRFRDVGPVNAAVIHAVTLGMLILVPGIIYALQYAFVPVVALMKPDAEALRTSADDSRPIRRRLFKILFLGFLADILLGLGVLLLIVLSMDLPMGTTLGMGFGWLVRQIPAGITGLPAWGIMVISVIATWAWGAARIGIAKAWLVRNEAATA